MRAEFRHEPDPVGILGNPFKKGQDYRISGFGFLPGILA